ncbi:MAG: UDP-N-acetylmuramoyl-L-alanyl-D-glutamate--2,6-diaminopimelate ligase [Ferrimonas sp.]
MRLYELLTPWLTTPLAPQWNIEFNDLVLDSRQVSTGDLFVALIGHQQDGRAFIDAAIAQGAVAVITEHDHLAVLSVHGAVPVIGLPQLSTALSQLGLTAYPAARQARLIGVTGTNGKTTVTQLCAQLLTELGQVAGVMGTVGNGVWGQLQPSVNTTSDALTVAKQLNAQVQAGADVVALEISSHGLTQGRVAALPIEVAVFTNLSRDHLDYHGDMASYAAAKRRLFSQPDLQTAVLNGDDEYGQRWLLELQAQGLDTICYTIDGAAGAEGTRWLRASQVHYHGQGICAEIDGSFGQGQLQLPLLGAFNLANTLAAMAALLAQGHNLSALLQAVTKLRPADGRMETFGQAHGPMLVVDYAHTPDALQQALQALRLHCHGRLWCVFGCGGDRDRGKRPLMAAAAEQGADHLVITADNPRSETFEAIVADMQTGLTQAPYLIEADRPSAVRQAYALADAADVILLAGKGHEDYQLIAGQVLPYSERQLAQQLTQSLVESGL